MIDTSNILEHSIEKTRHEYNAYNWLGYFSTEELRWMNNTNRWELSYRGLQAISKNLTYKSAVAFNPPPEIDLFLRLVI